MAALARYAFLSAVATGVGALPFLFVPRMSRRLLGIVLSPHWVESREYVHWGTPEGVDASVHSVAVTSVLAAAAIIVFQHFVGAT